MIRWGLSLGLAAGVAAFGVPVISPLHAMDEPAASRSEYPVSRGVSNVEPNPLWAIPLSALSATRERPIFSPSRRAPPPVVAAAPPAPRVTPRPPKAEEPERPPLTIVGTVSSEAGGIGIFLDQTTNTIIRLKTGESHAGWVLSAIQGREASFEKDHRTAILALPSRGAALSGRPVVAALAQAGGTWTDGDGQQIAPPPARMSQAAVGPPSGPPVSMSALAEAGGAWTDGDGQQITAPPAGASQGAVAPPGGSLAPMSPAAQAGATWTDGDGQQIAPPPGRMSQSMAASPVTDAKFDQNLN
jgi:general secretion pathway protein N